MPVPLSLARFGLFELDLNTGELLKSGRSLRLQEQPFRVLRLLLEHHGETVTREKLKDALWPADIYVDFDRGLNAAIAKLRRVLGDSAENPCFIETMARHGYRFIAPLEFANATDCIGVPSPAIKAKRFPVAPVPLLLIAAGLLLLIIGVIWFMWPRAGVTSGQPIRAIAVLPLENLSMKAEQDYFADGMTAELITELTKIPSLRVISRTSVMRYKRSTKSVKQIARELDVDALVEGEVLQSGSRVRVTAKLIQAAADKNLWAETFERDLHDLLGLQDDLARSIVSTVRINLTPAERARLAGHQRVDPEAYDSYLKARFFWNKRTQAGLQKSVDYFQLSIQKDPKYALAYSGLAESYNLLGGLGVLPRKDVYPLAKVAAENALRLDNSLGEAHTVLANILCDIDWNWRAAEMEFKRAIQLSPGFATGHQRYSLFLIEMGRTDESLSEIYWARQLDPLSLSINSSLGWRLLWARRYDDATNQLQRTLELEPNFRPTHLYLGWAYLAKGDPEKAIGELRQAAQPDIASEGAASLGYAYAKAGHTPQARQLLRQLEERFKSAQVAAYQLAIVYAGLGQKDRAFEFLAQSCRNRDREILTLKADLRLDDLRADSRFHSLLRCVGL